MAVNDIVKEAEGHMSKAVEFLKSELRGVRTGRASPGLVEPIRCDVESYGSSMTIKELATVAVADGNVIVVKPFDPATLRDIQRGIEKSGLGINPQNDGKVIRLPVPPLSTERRNSLVDQIKKMAEAQKVTVRNTRRDSNKRIETEKKAKTITEDDAKRGEEQTQKLTDIHIKKMDELFEQKSKEIMES